MTSSEESLELNSGTSPPEHARDEVYYFEDGSLVVLAGGHLFKIHRTLFARDSPFFQSLLSLPQGEDQKSPEGHSDEDPVVCPDSAEDFRALCWVVYSRPADVLAQQEWNTIDIPELIRVVAISHKYEFTAYREWAWNALDASYTEHPSDFFHKCSTWSAVSRILNLAIECRKRSFVDRLQQTWLDEISSSKHITAFKEALDAVESSDLLREFHAKCYYAYLRSSGIFEIQTERIIPIDLNQVGSHMDASLVDLSGERRMRLLTGFWSLSQLRIRLSQPPKLMDNQFCGKHASECIPGWESWWKNALNNAVRVGDPGQLIVQISEKAQSGIVVRSIIRTMKRDFDASLASRFMIS